MKLSQRFLVLFIFIFMVGITAAKAQSARPADKGNYFFFSAINFLLDKSSSSDQFFELSQSIQGKPEITYVRFSINETKKTISLNYYNRSKELITTELYNYTDQFSTKNARETDASGNTISKTWNVFATTKVE
jgi:hypothetical protein